MSNLLTATYSNKEDLGISKILEKNKKDEQKELENLQNELEKDEDEQKKKIEQLN